MTVENNKIINTESYPSIIINKLNTDYDSINYPNIMECKSITEKIINKGIDSHELVSYWMIQANQYIGNTFDKMIFRTQNKKEIEEKELDPQIKQIFSQVQQEGASYSYDKDYHHSLGLTKYTHMTSPIRRIVDTIIHWNITYPDSQIIFDSLDKINILDKKTKKFHRQLNLIDIINKLPDISEKIGWLYSRDNNKCMIYFEDIGFMKVKLWNDKFDYLKQDEDFSKYIIGKSYNFKIEKVNGILPNNRIWIKFI
jgi:hypothetical protein